MLGLPRALPVTPLTGACTQPWPEDRGSPQHRPAWTHVHPTPPVELCPSQRNPPGLPRHPSYNIAKRPLEFSTNIPRERLRASYGQGFRGAPLRPDTGAARPPQGRPGGHRGTTRTTTPKNRRGSRGGCSQSFGGGLVSRRLRAARPHPLPQAFARPHTPAGGPSQPQTLYRKEAVMRSLPVAIYARVSSDQQTEPHTIASQLSALRARVAADGVGLPEELQF